MGIQFSGISSGLPVNNIIQQLLSLERRPLDLLAIRKDTINVQKNQYAAVSSRATSLRSALTTLTDANLGINFSVFEGKKATSSNDGAVTATVTNEASINSFTVDVLNLATATKATSLSTIGQFTTGASDVSDVAEGVITSGNFTVFVNSQAQTISVDKTVDTVQDVIDRIATVISTVTGQAASGTVTADGKIELSYTAGTAIQFGATGDTTNFGKVTHLTTGSENGAQDTFTAKFGTSVIDKEGLLIGNDARLQNNIIAAGTFTVGGATFTIDGTTTLSGLIGQINSNSQAGVLISYDQNANKYTVTSRQTGEQAITFNDNGTGFLETLGLVSGTDTLSSQTLGLNAQFTVNGGATLESTSNSVDAATSGLPGVTLNLKGTTGGTAATIDITQDTDKLKNALTEFINKFNSLISFIDEQTGKTGKLQGEASLLRFRTRLRSEISSAISFNTEYKVLSQVGISTGPVNTNPQGNVSSTFKLDEAKLLAALADNPDEVKKLLVGDGGANKGILNVLEDNVEGALDPEFGLFSSRDKSANAQIKSINEAIKKGEDRLELKERQLRAQFTAMEQLISQFQSQQNAINNMNARFQNQFK